MCGIAGFSGQFDKGLLDRMGGAIAHRGPDDEGVFHDAQAGVGLAHRRLSIIDLSQQGHQPMWDTTGTVCIVFNGEIYNYRQIKAGLVQGGFKFKSTSDTEVLLNLYLRDGEKMVEKLNGIFAFALWDKRTKCLFLARDGVGVKPLYYSEIPKGFLFGSEMKAILQCPDVEKAISDEAMLHYLSYLWCPAPDTMFKQIKKLEPGYAMVISEGRIKKQWQFYDLPYDRLPEKMSRLEAEEAIRAHVRQAVERQMIADVEVGAFLSGGLDSSSIVAMMPRINQNRRTKCFTIGFRDRDFANEGSVPDLPYAQAVAERLNVDLHTIYVGAEMADSFEKMIYHLDEPQADPAPINVLFICQLAREHGIKVLMSGAGGDDIFSGYRRHTALLLEKYWAWAPKPIRAGMRNASHFITAKLPTTRRMAKAFAYADFDEAERIAGYFHWITPYEQLNLYSKDLRERLKLQPFSNPLVEALKKLPEDTPPLNKMLYLEGKFFLADHNLNYTDKMSMASGVETRVPLLDPDLIALAARIPVSLKQKGDTGKWIFRKAMEPLLPKNVIYRPKTGFGAPIRHWLKGRLRPLVDDILSESSLKKRGFFDFQGVNRLRQMDDAGKIDAAYPIFSLICTELWCRIFLDSSIPRKY